MSTPVEAKAAEVKKEVQSLWESPIYIRYTPEIRRLVIKASEQFKNFQNEVDAALADIMKPVMPESSNGNHLKTVVVPQQLPQVTVVPEADGPKDERAPEVSSGGPGAKAETPAPPQTPPVTESTPAPENPILAAALRCVQLGWYVFALNERDKTPHSKFSPHGFQSSTNDPNVVRGWFLNGTTPNYGIDLGRSNLTVLDFDNGLPPAALNLPSTLLVSTSRGTHAYLAGSTKTSKMVLDGQPLGDVKSAGGYVVGPKSIHPSGAVYELVQRVPVVPIPNGLLERLHAKDKPPVDATVNGAKIPRGQHDNTLRDIARKMRGMGLEYQAIRDALVEICENRCENYGSDYVEMCEKHAKSACDKFEPNPPSVPLAMSATTAYGAAAQQAPPPQAAPPVEWAEPRQLENKLTPVLPFLPEYLPLPVRSWCQDVAERMSLPLDFTGIAALVSISGAIGRRAFVYPKAFDKGWKESIALSGALVADSGKKKTPVWKEMVNPLVELEFEWREEYAKDLKAYKTLHKQWEKDVKTNPQEPEPEKPVCRRSVFADCTPEALHAAMEENPSGVLYFRDELASWVEELEQDGRQSQRGIFLCGMNGNDPYPLDRIGRGSVYATMCICVGGNFQPELLRRFLSDARNVEDGLVQRFAMLVWPNEVKLPRVDQSESLNKAAYRNVIRGLARLQYNKDEKKPPVELHFDSEAQKLYNEWDVQREERMDLVRGGRKSSLSKYSGMLPKAAALFQLADLAAGGATLGGTYYIDAHHTKMAMSFFQYLESHLNRVHSSAFELWQTVEFAIAKKITEGDMPDGMTARDITRKWNTTRTMRVDEIEMALENLAEHGWVRAVSIKPDGPGRPTKVWFVNPLAKGKEVYKAVTIAPAAPVDLEPPKKPVVAVKVVDLGAVEDEVEPF